MTSFSVEMERETPSATTISCSGELDVASCVKLIDAIESAYVPGLAVLKVDLFEVTFIDSTGMGCLIHGALQSTKQGVRFEIVPGEATLDLMRSCRFGNRSRQ